MTSSLVAAAPVSTAILAGVPSRQHQTKLRLTRAAWLAAASLKQLQDWSASCRAGLTDIIQWFLPRCLTHDLPVNWPGLRVRSLYARSAGSRRARDLPSQLSGSRPVACINTLTVQQFFQYVADRNHHQLPFATRLPSMVQELSGRRLTNGQKRTSGAAKND